MEIQIDEAILENYPEAQIGYLIAEVVVRAKDSYVEELKNSLPMRLKEIGVDATNFTLHPNIAVWRRIYGEDFGVKPKTFRSSVESLLKRVVTGKRVWDICNVVDLYNCCSLLSLLPMGGYDLDQIRGNITIRYGHEEERFHGLGMKEMIAVEPHQVVYADDERVLCYLWNHKDASDTCITEETKRVIFFIDCANPFSENEVAEALELLRTELEHIDGKILSSGILQKESPKASVATLV